MAYCTYFDKIAWIYHPLVMLSGRPKAYYGLIKRIAKPKISDNVLDVGGGTGLIADYFLQDARNVVVLDPSKGMLAKIKSSKIEKVVGVAQEIKFPDNTFDIIYCVDAFHHFTNGYRKDAYENATDSAIREMLRVLKPGGILAIMEFDAGKLFGKTAEFFENKIMRWGSRFYARDEFAELFGKYRANVSVCKLPHPEGCGVLNHAAN